MDVWEYYKGKKVFIVLKNGRQYSGKILEIENSPDCLVWITILDKFNNRITFCNSEIDIIQEEDKEKKEVKNKNKNKKEWYIR